MSSINQRLFLVNLIIVLVAMIGWRILFDIDSLTASGGAPGAVRAVQERFGWSIAAVLSVVVLLQIYLSRTISKPVKALIGEIDRALESGEPAHIAVRGHDELATLSARFNELQDRLARRIRELEQFAGNVCHEIRTPLTSILSAAEILDDGSSPFVAVIKSEAERIRDLSGTILTYARSVKSGAAPHKMRVDLATLVEALVNVPAYRDRVCFEGGTCEVETDPELLTQALSIVLDNSLRYSPEGSAVVIRLSSPDRAIVIANESPHIPEVFRERIFERFFSLAVAGRQKGTGIGLALCRDLIETLGGRIEAHNVAPRGVLFTVSLADPGDHRSPV